MERQYISNVQNWFMLNKIWKTLTSNGRFFLSLTKSSSTVVLHFSRLILLMATSSFRGLQNAACTTAVAPAPEENIVNVQDARLFITKRLTEISQNNQPSYMHSSTKLQSPPLSELSFCLCDKAYHKQKVYLL